MAAQPWYGAMDADSDIDKEMIWRLVHASYAKARLEVIGPVFEARIKNRKSHPPQMCTFWSWVAQGSLP